MKLGHWLRQRAENIAAIMLAVMFGAFIVQVAFRYLFNMPVGGASELTILMWLWIVLWTVFAAAALLFLYGYSLPAVWDYVTFMKVQDTSYLDIRYDYVYSIYIVFAVAVLIRYAWLFLGAVSGKWGQVETREEELQ